MSAQRRSDQSRRDESAWRDPKRYAWLLALAMPLLPFIGIGLQWLTGCGLWLWIGPIVILGVVPLLDLIIGLDRENPPDDVLEALERDRYYRRITYLFLPLQYAGFVTAMWYIATAELSTLDRVGLAVTVGFIGGLGINTAHELGHKRESVERWLSKIALAQTFYGHFAVEHNRGHHVRVATPEDPASSRLGESFYRFWPRTVAGSVVSAWWIERRRLGLRGRHPLRLGNEVVNAWLMSLALWLVMVAWLGLAIVPYLVIQALVGLTLLEAVNYLEHYGLLRQKVGTPGRERYERVDPRHSWNSNNVATNVLLYHLQRHSDHHANPTRRYQALRDFDSSPVLPTGYAGMILLALVPPAWRATMDSRVLAHVDGDVRRANISPHCRERVLARHGFPVAASDVAAMPAESGAVDDVGVIDDAGAGDSAVDAGRPSACVAACCPVCGYTYEEVTGAPREGFPAGTPWSAIPDTWCCPDCGVREKVDFHLLTR